MERGEANPRKSKKHLVFSNQMLFFDEGLGIGEMAEWSKAVVC
jgi:hypothetical protein